MNDKWAEISIHTTQEATEAVAAVFHELGAGGVVIEDPDLIQSYRRSGNWTDCIFPDEPAVDFVTVVAYLPSDEELPGKLRILSNRIDELAGHSLDKGQGTIRWREVRETEWADSWKRNSAGRKKFRQTERKKRWNRLKRWKKRKMIWNLWQ